MARRNGRSEVAALIATRLKRPLRFRRDGTFTIVQFTDVHWHDGCPADLRSLRLMEDVLTWERPDFVAFTGDQVGGAGCADPAAAFWASVQAAERAEIPWASAFGNHDDEGSASKDDLVAAQQAGRFCLTAPGDYALRVRSADGDRLAAALYFIDSGGNAPEPIGGWAWVRHEQVVGFRRCARRLQEEAAGGTGALPALAFFHIPVREFDELWNTQPCVGWKFEGVCSPKINTGLFAALLECGVAGAFVGHEHVNDFEGELHGVRLHYGRATGYNTYGRDGYQRGARVIRLREGSTVFETWVRLADGSLDPRPPHSPELPKA